MRIEKKPLCERKKSMKILGFHHPESLYIKKMSYRTERADNPFTSV